MGDYDALITRAPMGEFRYKEWSLFDAIDALRAHDGGAYDSGVADEDLRRAVKEYVTALPDEERRLLLCKYARRFLTDESLSVGYGLDDVIEFMHWLSDMDIYT